MICLQCGKVIKCYIAGSVACPECGSIMSDEDHRKEEEQNDM